MARGIRITSTLYRYIDIYQGGFFFLFLIFLLSLFCLLLLSAFYLLLLERERERLWREDEDGEVLRREIDRLWWAVTFLTADGPPGIACARSSLAAVHAHLRSTFPTHGLFLACRGRTDRHEQERTGWWQIG